MVHDATTFARTGTVIAMPQPMAQALGWPNKPIGWRDLARVAAQPRGWAAYGHPEWGEFRLGKANPTQSTTALLATIAVSRLHDPQLARTLEQSVIYYGDDDWPFLDNWLRLDKAKKSTAYVSAVVTDQRAVDAYNAGSSNGNPPKPGQSLKKPHTPLVAITPSDGTFAADTPLAPIDAQWVTTGARAGAQAFVAFSRTPQAQQQVAKNDFQVGGALANLGAYEDAATALDDWATIRKPARLLLLFDVSDSMGDPADPKVPDGPTKIERAKAALLDALSRLAPDDEVGLRIFTTDADGVKGRNWADVVPIGRLDQQRAQLVSAINALKTQKGSPLYPAVRGAFDSMNRHIDSARINGVVVLTDGHNEYDADNNKAELLSHLHEPVRMFTISYSPDADLPTLRKIAEATSGSTKISVARGSALRMSTSSASIACASSATDRLWSNSILAATTISSGPSCSVRRWMHRCTSRLARIAVPMRATTSGRADSPTSRLPISITSTIATATSSAPIATLPAPSQRELPVACAMRMPANASERPMSAAKSSRITTGKSELFVLRMNRHHDSPSGRTAFASFRAVRSEKPSMTAAPSSTMTAHHRSSSSCGLRNLSIPSKIENTPPRLKSTNATMNE
jgi:Ca-activated chloride channel family protein